MASEPSDFAEGVGDGWLLPRGVVGARVGILEPDLGFCFILGRGLPGSLSRSIASSVVKSGVSVSVVVLVFHTTRKSFLQTGHKILSNIHAALHRTVQNHTPPHCHIRDKLCRKLSIDLMKLLRPAYLYHSHIELSFESNAH